MKTFINYMGIIVLIKYINIIEIQLKEAASHVVVIATYGFENTKYYWIIHNSWGK